MALRILLSLTLAVLLTPLLYAEDQPAARSTAKDDVTKDAGSKDQKPKTEADRKAEETLKMLLDKYDKNMDGKLDAEERKALREDREKESPDPKARPRNKKTPTRRTNPLLQRILAKYDKNRDGKLDLQEQRSYAKDVSKNRQQALRRLQQMMRRMNRGSSRGRGRSGRRGGSRNSGSSIFRRLQQLRQRQLKQLQQRKRQQKR